MEKEMNMEEEYKWKIEDKKVFHDILNSNIVTQALVSKQDIQMQAIYYDTEDHLLAQMRGALRLRKENDASVCCLKLAEQGEGALKSRKEYEVTAQDVYSGLMQLKDIIKTEELGILLRSNSLVELCRTDFVRNACLLHVSMPFGTCSGELAFDFGEISCGTHSAPLCEMEFEYKNGDLQSFHDFARELERTFTLNAQPLSKMARAMNLKC